MKTPTTPLAKVYDEFSSDRLQEFLQAFETDRRLGEADEDFCVARIDTITAILQSRGLTPNAMPLLAAAVPS